jgi:tetratricopeptide (TPR) repeat protein
VEASRQPLTIGNISTALGWYEAALDIDPLFAAAHAGECELFIAAFTEMDNRDYMQRAESSCATALELNANLDVVHTSLGRLSLATGRHDDAEASFRRALEIDPSSARALMGLGEVYRLEGRPEDAETNLRLAIDLHPGNALAYNNLGLFLFRSGRYAEAAEEYQHAVALEPDNMNAFSNIGAARMLLGDFDLAAPAYQRAIEIEPTKTAYSNLGLMYYYLGDYELSIDSHRNAVRLKENDYLARSNLGDALWVAGNEDDALAEFSHSQAIAEKVLEVNPNDPFTMMDLSWIYAMQGALAKARGMIDKALELSPEDPYAHYYDGMVSLREGDRSAALDALELAVDKGYPVQMLAAEPHLNSIANNPRFANMVFGDQD